MNMKVKIKREYVPLTVAGERGRRPRPNRLARGFPLVDDVGHFSATADGAIRTSDTSTLINDS